MHFGKMPEVRLDLRLLSKSHKRFPAIALSHRELAPSTHSQRHHLKPNPHPLKAPKMLHFGAPELSVQKQTPGLPPLPDAWPHCTGVLQQPHSLPAPMPGVLHPAANWGNGGAVPWEGSLSPALPPTSP